MARDSVRIGSAKASPTKAFFVQMLTRDIELQDAILDLLDNCVDGIVRAAPNPNGKQPYKDFEATIELAPGHFSIIDNCGGIPFDVGEKYAFAMGGRPPEVNGQASLPTVGMYGIGMKRAIFKMGTEALVESRHDKGFSVEFTQKWMTTNSWDDLPMKAIPNNKFPEKGTSIIITELNEETKAQFADEQWVDDFRATVARHYALIIAKGFTVLIGDGKKKPSKISPEAFQLLRTEPVDKEGSRIAPFVYTGKLHGVDVEIYAGLYRSLPNAEELEEEEETRGSSDDAGWIVACNDRVVVWKDKTRLTGWGEATVPNYHGQFIAITGIVLLHSTDPKKLPLTTTKRGLDAGTIIYSELKDLMRDATKKLTSFTNKWKKFPEKLDDIYLASDYVGLPQLRSERDKVALTALHKLPTMKRYAPVLPEPAAQKTDVSVKFTAKKSEVRLMADIHFGEDENPKPGEVGQAVFKQAVKDARASRR